MRAPAPHGAPRTVAEPVGAVAPAVARRSLEPQPVPYPAEAPPAPERRAQSPAAVVRPVEEEAPLPETADDAARDAADMTAILEPEKRRLSPAMLGVIGVGALALIAIGAYSMLPRSSSKASRPATAVDAGRAAAPTSPQTAATDAPVEGSLPYVYRRQPVYYRTTNPVGTVIVDKSQRLLYLVQPNVSALRYGIGVGRGCLDVAGLLRVTKKEEVPDAPAKALGARVIYLGTDSQVIHGTDSSKNIGGEVPKGCFLLVNDAVVDLYDRIAVGAGVVVTD
jgi:lipoprotein-anchoring transpeptidase ErfK/SrfK